MFIVSISDKINNERRWNKKWRWALYLAYTHTLPPDLERDCTRPGQGLYVCLSNLQAIVTLLQFSDSPLPTPFFFLHQNPLPLSSTPNPFPTSPLLFQPLFFAAPTSSSFTPSSPPLVEAAREESCLHTGPPFPRADGLSPFSPRPDASTRKLFTFSSFLPSCSPFPCLSLFLPSFLPLPLLSHGCERVI